MLNIWFGDMPDVIYDTSTYFRHSYRDQWITDPLSVEMIRDVDQSEVVADSHPERTVKTYIPDTERHNSRTQLSGLCVLHCPAIASLLSGFTFKLQFATQGAYFNWWNRNSGTDRRFGVRI